MVENPYVQFPLCALAFGQTINERLNTILDYAVVHAGFKVSARLSPDQWEQFWQQRRQVGNASSLLK
jgi:hypothetical protein